MKYKFGFNTKIKNNLILNKGLSEKVVRQISKIKSEPKWMLNFRLNSYKIFKKLKNPAWGPSLVFINFDEYYYFSQPIKDEQKEWKNLPQSIKNTFNKLKVPEIEAKILSGINNQFDSKSIYHNIVKEFEQKGVIFCSIDEAIKKHSKIVKKYFAKLVCNNDNKYAALNSCVWSGGSFLYVPKNVKIDKPLQSYFRINTKSVGQFERTLIIIEENSEATYMEGCTAPIYDKNNLHAAVVEVFVNKNARFRYSTIQNWSTNVLNLVTKRAIVSENGYIEWIDGNIGSGLNMKYPSTILMGNNSAGKCISVATSGKNMIQDTGAKMIHIGKNTRSSIISKSIATNGGTCNYRGLIKITSQASESFSEVICDSLILDDKSKSDTIPNESIYNNTSFIKHEAKVSEMDKEILFYLNSRGIEEKEAKHLFSLGFIQPFIKELPLEYAVELNRLLKTII